MTDNQKNILHQFATQEKGVFICADNGSQLPLLGSGRQTGLHWAVFRNNPQAAHVELVINGFRAEIFRVEPNNNKRLLWRGTIYKDNQNPPKQSPKKYKTRIS